MLHKPPYLPIEPTLNEFVKEFGGELVSELMPPNSGLNADYIFRNSSEVVIAELKCLEKDLFNDEDFKARVDELYKRWKASGLVPESLFKRVQLSTDSLPRECAMDLFKLIKRPIEAALSKASSQITATRNFFDTPDAKGLLLIVNDNNYGIDPIGFVGTVGWILENQEKAGIDSALCFTINMTVEIPEVKEENLLWVETFRSKKIPVTDDFLSQLRDAWFKFYNEKIGHDIPWRLENDHSILSKAKNIRPPNKHEDSPDPTGEQRLTLFQYIDQGLNTQFVSGKYYCQPQTGFSYYCSMVEHHKATLFLVEGYKNRELIRTGPFVVPIQMSACFVVVEDQERIVELEQLLLGVVEREYRRGYERNL